MNKKVLCTSLVVAALLGVLPMSASAEDLPFQSYSVINYGTSKIQGRCFYANGRTYVPLRLVSQMTGYAVTWTESNQGIGIVDKDTVISCTPHSDSYSVNGKTKTLGVQPILNNGTTYVPTNFISDVLGLNYYDNSLNTITILPKGQKVTITVTDTSEYYDDSQPHEGDWIEGDCSEKGLSLFYVTSDTSLKGSVKFRNIKKGDVLEVTLGSRVDTGVDLKDVYVRSANDNGYLEYAGSITSISSSQMKVSLLGSNTTYTFDVNSDTEIRVQGSSRKIKLSDLERGMDVYGTYTYTSPNKGKAVSIVVGDADDSSDKRKGDTVTFDTSKITSKGTDYIYVDIDGKSVKLEIDDDTSLKDTRNSLSKDASFSSFSSGNKVYGTYEYVSSSRGIAKKLCLTNDSLSSGDGNYLSGDRVSFDKCKVTKVTSSAVTVKIDGIEVVLTINNSTKIHPNNKTTSLRYKDIDVGDYVNVEYKYSTAFKGTAYDIGIINYSGSTSSSSDDDYDYNDIVSFKGYIVSADSDDDYITVKIDGTKVKLEIDDDTVVKKGSTTVSNPSTSTFRKYIDYDVSGKYYYKSSTKGLAYKITIDTSSYDDDDYDTDTVSGEVTQVGSSYIKVEDDDGYITKVYIDDDTTIKKSGKSSTYNIDDIDTGDEVKVYYEERSSSKNVATKITIY